MYESGRIIHPDPQMCSWIPAYEEELVQFPNADKDDQVDASTQFFDYYFNDDPVEAMKALVGM